MSTGKKLSKNHKKIAVPQNNIFVFFCTELLNIQSGSQKLPDCLAVIYGACGTPMVSARIDF